MRVSCILQRLQLLLGQALHSCMHRRSTTSRPRKQRRGARSLDQPRNSILRAFLRLHGRPRQKRRSSGERWDASPRHLIVITIIMSFNGGTCLNPSPSFCLSSSLFTGGCSSQEGCSEGSEAAEAEQRAACGCTSTSGSYTATGSYRSGEGRHSEQWEVAGSQELMRRGCRQLRVTQTYPTLSCHVRVSIY